MPLHRGVAVRRKLRDLHNDLLHNYGIINSKMYFDCTPSPIQMLTIGKADCLSACALSAACGGLLSIVWHLRSFSFQLAFSLPKYIQNFFLRLHELSNDTYKQGPLQNTRFLDRGRIQINHRLPLQL